MNMDAHRQHASSESDASSSHKSVFVDSSTTPLYSSAWQPGSVGAYAGTCFFLILLAALLRCLIAGKGVLERRWLAKAKKRRYIKVEGAPTEADKIDEGSESEYGTLLSAQGHEERVKVVTSRSTPVLPWRLSVDLPRALYVTVTAGVAYLL